MHSLKEHVTQFFFSFIFLEYATSAGATIMKSSAAEDDRDNECLVLRCRCLCKYCGPIPTLAESVCCREIEKKLKKRLRPTHNFLGCSMHDRVVFLSVLAYRQQVVLFTEEKAYWKFNLILM